MAEHRTSIRRLTAGLALAAAALVLASCGGADTSMSEYAAELESLVATMNARLDLGTQALDSEPSTVELIRKWADDRIAARDEFIDTFNAIPPPKEAEDLHAAAADTLGALVAAEKEMVAEIHRIDDLATLQQIWSSPAGQAARVADERAVEICQAAQAAMDSTADRSQFVGTPWVPAELQDIVRVTFGCTPADR